VRTGAKKPVRKVTAKKAAPAGSPDSAREQLDAVSRVMKALATPSVDLDGVADMIVKAVMRLAGADSAAFMRRDPIGWVRAATQGMADLRKGARVDPGPQTLWGRSALTGKPIHIADTKLAEPTLPDAEHRRTRLAVPILREQESIGVIFLSRDDPDRNGRDPERDLRGGHGRPARLRRGGRASGPPLRRRYGDRQPPDR